MIKNILKSFIKPSNKLYKILSYLYNYAEINYLPKKISGIENIFENLSKSQPKVTFVQVGSNDGVSNDPLFYFINTYNWCGTLIEPMPFLFEKLNANYLDKKANLQFMNIAVSAEEEAFKVIYSIDEKYRGELPDWYFQLGSFYRHVLYHHEIPLIDNYIKAIEVPVSTIQKIIDQNMNGYIDLLHIDAEGYDFEILKTLNLKKSTPKVILIEYINLDIASRKAMVKLLKSYGYRLYRCGQDFMSIHYSVHSFCIKEVSIFPIWD